MSSGYSCSSVPIRSCLGWNAHQHINDCTKLPFCCCSVAELWQAEQHLDPGRLALTCKVSLLNHPVDNFPRTKSKWGHGSAPIEWNHRPLLTPTTNKVCKIASSVTSGAALNGGGQAIVRAEAGCGNHCPHHGECEYDKLPNSSAQKGRRKGWVR